MQERGPFSIQLTWALSRGGVAMPLAATTQEALGALEDICLIMTDGEAAVRVEVQRQLLVAIGGRGQNSPALQWTILEEHRAQVERVASDKYDDGNYQRYANGSVVRITRADWERYKHA
jgi:hypothetical protein